MPLIAESKCRNVILMAGLYLHAWLSVQATGTVLSMSGVPLLPHSSAPGSQP